MASVRASELKCRRVHELARSSAINARRLVGAQRAGLISAKPGAKRPGDDVVPLRVRFALTRLPVRPTTLPTNSGYMNKVISVIITHRYARLSNSFARFLQTNSQMSLVDRNCMTRRSCALNSTHRVQ
jgi:hypothetical protein